MRENITQKETLIFIWFVTGMTILHPADEDNISDRGIIHDEVIRTNEESHHH